MRLRSVHRGAPQRESAPSVARDAGKTAATEAVAALRTHIDQWEAEGLAVARAQDAFNFRRADGIGRLGAVLGELRALVGGSARAAYAYTQPGRSRNPPPVDEEAAAGEG